MQKVQFSSFRPMIKIGQFEEYKQNEFTQYYSSHTLFDDLNEFYEQKKLQNHNQNCILEQDGVQCNKNQCYPNPSTCHKHRYNIQQGKSDILCLQNHIEEADVEKEQDSQEKSKPYQNQKQQMIKSTFEFSCSHESACMDKVPSKAYKCYGDYPFEIRHADRAQTVQPLYLNLAGNYNNSKQISPDQGKILNKEDRLRKLRKIKEQQEITRQKRSQVC